MKLRKAVIQDVEKLASLVNSAYRGDSSKKGWTTEADLLDGQRTDAQSLTAQMTQNESVMLVYDENEVILACVFLHRKDSRTAYLGMFTVHPELQGRGLGKEILAGAEKYCQSQWGSHRIEMTVIRQRPELIDWYERRGYKKTGRTQDFPYGDERFGIPKRPDLVMEILTKDF
ncbi:MAG: GNAT family N-acetyltransferase [Proteobacteria bacterium]|nr:GNAT family N-acetyltransferase [Pseudomonadota bacterium]